MTPTVSVAHTPHNLGSSHSPSAAKQWTSLNKGYTSSCVRVKFLPSISFSKKKKYATCFRERNNLCCLRILCYYLYWQTNQVVRAKHKGFNKIAFFRFFAECSEKHSENFLPSVIRKFVCLNYCRYKNLPGEAHSSTSQNKQAPTSWVNLTVISAQISEIICKL